MVYNMVKDSCQGTKEFVAWQKIVGLQIFSTPSLNFGDSWENFGKWKNRSLQKWLPVDRLFCKTNKILLGANKA